MKDEQLEDYYRGVIPREKLHRQVTAGMYISDAELRQLWKDRNETVTADYVALNLSQLVPGDVEVSEGEIREYYENNQERFRRPSTARLNLAVLSKAPTAADSAASLQRAQAVRQELVRAVDIDAPDQPVLVHAFEIGRGEVERDEGGVGPVQKPRRQSVMLRQRQPVPDRIPGCFVAVRVFSEIS